MHSMPRKARSRNRLLNIMAGARRSGRRSRCPWWRRSRRRRRRRWWRRRRTCSASTTRRPPRWCAVSAYHRHRHTRARPTPSCVSSARQTTEQEVAGFQSCCEHSVCALNSWSLIQSPSQKSISNQCASNVTFTKISLIFGFQRVIDISTMIRIICTLDIHFLMPAGGAAAADRDGAAGRAAGRRGADGERGGGARGVPAPAAWQQQPFRAERLLRRPSRQLHPGQQPCPPSCSQSCPCVVSLPSFCCSRARRSTTRPVCTL